MRRHGHPIFGAIVGFFLFLFVAVDLVLFGTIRTYSNLITILPLVGIAVGFLWGWWSPFRRRRRAATTRAPAAPTPDLEPVPTMMEPDAPDSSDGQAP